MASLWPSVLPHSDREACWFRAASRRRRVARKAFAAMCANYITPEGVVKGTCQGTNIGFKIEYYADRKRPDDDLHGRGVVLLACTEILNPKM